MLLSVDLAMQHEVLFHHVIFISRHYAVRKSDTFNRC